MITFVCWKWEGPDPKRSFTSAHVNVLRAMIERNYAEPHKLVCITDNTHKLDPRIEAFPLPDTKLEHLVSPMRAKPQRHFMRPAKAQIFPACYRRLWLFSEAAKQLGEWLFLLDIDCVITNDLAPIIRTDTDFVGWTDERFGWNKIAGGAWLLRAGSHTEVWTDFDPFTSPEHCLRLGLKGSDQAWLSHKLFPPAERLDGLYKINWLRKHRQRLNSGVRIAFTAGHCPPWNPQLQNDYPWIRKHWTL